MATEVRRERVLGNFKPPKSVRVKAKAKRSKDKRIERPGNSEAHLAAIRKCPCIVTLRMPAGEAHHLKEGTGERGAGMRSSDRWAVPLSRGPHEEIERIGSRNETSWFKRHGIDDPIGLADALWHASPDVKVMTRIILANRRQFPALAEGEKQ